MTRRQMLASLDEDEFWLWAALERVEPIADTWLQSAVLIRSMIGLVAPKARVKVGDIYPFLKKQGPAATLEETDRALTAWALTHQPKP